MFYLTAKKENKLDSAVNASSRIQALTYDTKVKSLFNKNNIATIISK